MKRRSGRVKKRAPTARSHEEATIESFRKDPEFAAYLLSEVLADGDVGEFLDLMKYMTKAFGGMAKVAAGARLNETSLYRALSRRGNPELKSFSAILKAMGMRIAIQVEERPKAARVRQAA